MRVLVCGGRDFNDYQLVSEVLQDYSIATIIEGGARGADTLGYKYGKANGCSIETYKAKWDEYGKGAGPIRNQQMLDEGKPDLVVAFPGGRGTKDMVSRAKKAGVKVIEVD